MTTQVFGRFQGTEDYNSYLNRVYIKSDPLLLNPLAWKSPASPSISVLKHVTDSRREILFSVDKHFSSLPRDSLLPVLFLCRELVP